MAHHDEDARAAALASSHKTEALDEGGGQQPAVSGCLIFVADTPTSERGRYYRLERGRIRVGSSAPCEFVLGDSTISRQHAELSVRADGIVVEDLGSTNGTFYLGQRVDRIVLKPGARLQLGRCTIDLLPLEGSTDAPISSRDSYDDLVGASLAMRRLYGMLERLEGREVPVLVTGETGTGKDLVARALHRHSPRANKPFVVVDCGQVQRELVNSELFGHRRGAFTGAVGDRPGAFEAASGGTVFLDEIGELPLDLQPKLLRVLESGEFSRLGDTAVTRADVRVIAATHRDLGGRVRSGEFREDLYYRLAVISIGTPPLRERREDIPMLVESLAAKLSGGGDAAQIPEAAISFMTGYDWPGNVRELRNAVHRLLVLGTMGVGGVGPGGAPVSRQAAPHLAAEVPGGGELSYRDARDAALRQFEAAFLRSVLDKSKGNLSQAARIAGIDRKYLRELLKRHDLY